ncbi:MAG: MFS transporter [SAR86 cluster bacterium]|jgi:Na+/melibiose symporter-like transporter|uniref:MFS transporter n=1 Tax=SAR86 cluster bacterium TaxID=2030880 RepID=A0A972VY29_9GAMM|nr:MFS transporter [SAR86 cluster bacterium]
MKQAVINKSTTDRDASRLRWSVISAYGAPGVGAGYMYLLIGLYIMKFSTDVLLIAPAVMGTIFGISRVWDAVSDPLVGYMSDRTRHPLGRRRLWLLLSIVPISGTFIMVFSPPASLHGTELIAWMAVGVIGFYSAATIFIVPHMSLGAELTPNYHERSRLYGLRHAAFTIGSILALVSMQLLINAERVSEAAVRQTAFELSALAALVTAGLILYAVVKLRERPDYQGRVNASPFGAFKDVWRNHHARLVLAVSFIENIGSAVIGILTLYVAQYVVGRPELAALIILSYMIPSTLSVPLWIPLSRRFGKIRLWMFSMMLTGVSFGGMFSLPWLEPEIRLVVIFGLAVFAGLAAGCGGTIAPSVQSDIIDYDEYMTGERKEGSYFAAFNFVHKSATGVMILITGYVLQFSGFVPNQLQTMNVQVSMVFLYGLLPLICYCIGAALFSRFTLDEATHQQMRDEMDARR